ncbi:unnamed protein product [Pleuronectes platessa]|uniref:Uncharacterized protein n=1 Tax=Pleuronectes platessa TaxID=8262 RepID=A0A9N7UTH3_PLEPL|nr:unnamed protein product [Pleuronectes platessa]
MKIHLTSVVFTALPRSTDGQNRPSSKSEQEDSAGRSPKDKSCAAHLRQGEGEVVIKNWERTKKSIREPSAIPALWRRRRQPSTPPLRFPYSPLHGLWDSRRSDRSPKPRDL